MSKDLAFVFSREDIEDLLEKDVIYFPLTTIAKGFLIDSGKDYQIVENFFPTGVKNEIFDLSEKLSFHFTKPKINNLPSLSFSLNNFLAKRMFYLACVDSIFKKFEPKKVYIGKEENGFKKKFVSSFDAYSPILMAAARKYKVGASGGTSTPWILKYAVQLMLLPKVKSVSIPDISKKVIVFAANTYHVENCMSLLSAILKNGEMEPLVVGKLGNSKRDLKGNKIRYIDYNGSIDLVNIPQYLFAKLFLTVAAIFYVRREKIDFLGYDLWDLVKSRLFSLFLTDLPALYQHEIFYSKILDKYHVEKFIYLTNASNIQTYIQMNSLRGIESVEIQHGITFGADSKHFSGDKLVTWGKIPFEILSDKGISRQKLVIGGWPPYILYGKQKQYKGTTPKKSKAIRILFLAQDSDGLFLLNMVQTADKSFENLFKALTMIKFKYELILRLHPRGDTKIPRLISKKYNITFELSGGETLGDVINISDLVIAQTTSAALDAMILNKPVIYFPSMEWGVKFLDTTNVSAVANSAGSLAQLIAKCSTVSVNSTLHNGQGKFLKDYCNFGQISLGELAMIVTGNVNEKN